MSDSFKILEIKNHPGYFVDTNGKIYSQWINKGRSGLHRGVTLKELKGSSTKNSHVSIQFGRNGGRKFLHRLVYETFVDSIPNGMVIRHLDDNPKNNKLSNLVIGTQADNVNDCIRNGNFKFPPAKLNHQKVAEIRSLKKESKLSNEKIAKKYNVSRKLIDMVIKNQCWKEEVNQ